jgi:hypothetical protein
VVPVSLHGGYQKCHRPVHDHCPPGRPLMFHDLQERLPVTGALPRSGTVHGVGSHPEDCEYPSTATSWPRRTPAKLWPADVRPGIRQTYAWDGFSVLGSCTPGGGLPVQPNSGGNDQSPGLLKSISPPENSASPKRTSPPENLAS